MIAAGEFRNHRITIQNPVFTKDENGSDIQTWETVYENIPAKKRPLSVNQFIAADAQQSEVRGHYVIRKMPGLRDDQRIIENGVIHDIKGWLPDPETGEDYVSAPYSEGVNRGGF
jgi:SPP1 family predicted phage head-tail adaptor